MKRAMDVNLICYLFTFNSSFMILVRILIYAENHLPVFITRTFHYGKHSINAHQPLVATVEVPKRWFRHFYVFAAPAFILSLIMYFYKYIMNGKIPEIIYRLLDASLGTSRKALISPECGFLAMILLTIHSWKRYYETHYISVFSDKKINISHYIVGYLHYAGTIISIMGESYGFVRDSHKSINWYNITLLQIISVNIFLLASLMQLKSNFILANLRKSNNKVVFDGYKIPHGGLFEYISSPLQLTEICIYLSLSVILWQSNTFHYITIWVIINQMVCAIMEHIWYQKTFQNYPKKRKMIIPYLF
ncbi:hypothetical protein M0802_001365 [Mischocyttarus mexicanus]|nr:hypothetical protein M0802_001365 [Mischocyttarus mexicanus]